MTKYQIHGHDSLMQQDYVEPTLYDTYADAFALAHSNHEWVVKVELELELELEGYHNGF